MQLKIKKGKGVLSKDGSPYAARTAHIHSGGWKSPIGYDIHSIMEALCTEGVVGIEVIDEKNILYTISIDRSKKA